jgi:Na+-transporting NADH:ubiquinone oxidoreductase subunit C
VRTAKDSKSDAIRSKLSNAEDVAGIGGYREKYSMVYRIKDEQGNLVKYVFPIRGSGLWSVLKGFISLEKDLQTIAGITFYEHAETPGLGGEVDNPSWKNKWPDKKVYGEDGEVKIKVAKGAGSGEYQVDGLSGATITSRGVSNMLEFWMGDSGFESYIAAQKQNSAAGSSVEQGDK